VLLPIAGSCRACSQGVPATSCWWRGAQQQARKAGRHATQRSSSSSKPSSSVGSSSSSSQSSWHSESCRVTAGIAVAPGGCMYARFDYLLWVKAMNLSGNCVCLSMMISTRSLCRGVHVPAVCARLVYNLQAAGNASSRIRAHGVRFRWYYCPGSQHHSSHVFGLSQACPVMVLRAVYAKQNYHELQCDCHLHQHSSWFFACTCMIWCTMVPCDGAKLC
jgi:hypothetical protein